MVSHPQLSYYTSLLACYTAVQIKNCLKSTPEIQVFTIYSGDLISTVVLLDGGSFWTKVGQSNP